MCPVHDKCVSIFITSLLLLFMLPANLQADNSRFNASKRFLYVQPGQTASSIVKTLYPDDESRWLDVTGRLVINNPHAFENGNVNRIIVGARIEIPPIQTTPSKPAPKKAGNEVVGSVIAARGNAFAIYTDKKRRDIKTGSDILAGDRLYTGVDGYMRMKMIDDASIELRCNSEMLIESYKMVPNGNSSVIHLLKGSLHKVTGKIGKNITDRYELRTPVATIGVRGTEYAVRVLQSHGCGGTVDVDTDGMFIKVSKGEIDLSNQSGDSILATGNAALITTNTTQPRAVLIKDGVFKAVVPKPTPPVYVPVPPPVIEPEPPAAAPVEKEEKSWWWWVLGILVIVAL